MDLAALAQALEAVAPDWERQALPPPERRAAALAVLATLPQAGLRPFGLEPSAPAPTLWMPYARSRDRVERYGEGSQEPGCQLDWLRWDEAARTLEIGLILELPSKCPRFAGRACPRMAPMGHDSEHADCNYWAWPGMEALTPKLELYPEWQRFDCHKYYPLFQAHLVGEALASDLDATPSWRLLARPEAKALLKVYAGLTSRPDAFHFEAHAHRPL